MKSYLNFFALSIAELINLFLGFKKVTFRTTGKLRLSYQEVILVLYWKSLVLELLSTSLICEHEHSRELTTPGGGTPIYGLYRYVPRNRVWFLRFSVLK